MSERRFTMREIAEAFEVPKRKMERWAVREGWRYEEEPHPGRPRRLYNLADLPENIQIALLKAHGITDAPTPVSRMTASATRSEADTKASFSYDAKSLWAWAETRTQKLRDKGVYKADLLRQTMRLQANGERLQEAFKVIAAANELSAANLKNWYYGVNGTPGARAYAEKDWDAALIPGYVGRTKTADMPAPAWDWYCAYYLSRRRPSAAESYRRVCEVAAARDWGELPSAVTFHRRLHREYAKATIVLRREGEKAMMKLYPPQRRDKTVFASGEAVVGDGLKFDRLWVEWPDGEIVNTSTGWFWADVRSNYIAAYRLAKTENTDLFRLATYDLTARFKPDYAWMDNTMVAANKAMTGRAENRHRFSVKADDPVGLLQQMDITPCFTNPDKVMGSPGAKPIERSFGIGGLHDKVATHPRLLDRGYSKATAIPYAEFAAVVAEEVQRFNRQPKRRTPVCRGVLSFREAFEESFSKAIVKKLTKSQRSLLLLMPEVVRASQRSGEIALKAGRGPMGQHRFWTEKLIEYKGHRLVAYYDPQALTRPITVHTLDGRYICQADHRGDVAFNDTSAAREHAKNKARYRKANKKAAAAQQRMRELEVAARYPKQLQNEAEIPESSVVAGNFQQKMVVDTATGEVLDRGAMDEPGAFEGVFVDLISSMQAAIKQREEERI